MTIKQLEIMILYLIGFFTDQQMRVICGKDKSPVLIDGIETYISDIRYIDNERISLDILLDKICAIKVFEYTIYNMSNSGINVYTYYGEIDENNKLSITVRTDCNLISSDFYYNHCLAYMEILLKLHNVYIDLHQFDKKR